MGRSRRSVLGCPILASLALLIVILPSGAAVSWGAKPTLSATSAAAQPIEITADHLEYIQGNEVYEAVGSVKIVQGPLQLTADRVTVMMLSGTLIATGHTHLKDPTSDLWADRLELDVNTDAGVITNGKLFMKESNTLVTGRLLQRFSEDHYRAKEGSFTNCDAKEGQVPAWRFTFKDMDLNAGESFYGKDVWFCVNDVPVLPLPSLNYPVQSGRKSGFLVPTVGYDNRFGMHYRQGFFWAVDPSQDITVTPDYLSNRGYGGDLEYRYVWDRNTRGQWLGTFIEDTKVGRGRALLTGAHTQKVTDTLSIRAQANLLSDPNYYNDLSNTGFLRALPSQESNINVNKRLPTGNVYLLGQYLQPLQVGGNSTFQRLPELGYSLLNVAPFDNPLVVGLDTTVVNWHRDQGFQLNRVDFMPGIGTETLNVGDVVGLTPQVRLREVYYTRGVTTAQSVHRETFWASLDATTRLTRRFNREGGGSLLHTIEPDVIYEFVPATSQSQIVQIDAVDDLPKKNLVTYKLRNRLLGMGPEGATVNWLDLTLAQSYHVGGVQTQARQFPFPDSVQYTTLSQQLQPTMVAVAGRKFSDIWARGVIGNPISTSPRDRPVSLTVDTFFDPYERNLSQWNTDLRYQHGMSWYAEVGQRYTREGNRVRRGDIWNPLSFGEVFAPTPTVQYVTAAGGVRLPYGWTVGAKTYYDLKSGVRPETDVVAVYQNPCRCWSLGLYYIQFPDRVQYNFLISLTGIGATEGVGTMLIKSILYPLLMDEKGLPWPSTTARQPIVPEAAPGGSPTMGRPY
ncbi:MAG: LPS assembly protein LptD [Nitrospirota bacterium]